MINLRKELAKLQQQVDDNISLKKKLRSMGQVYPISQKHEKYGFIYFIKTQSENIKIGWAVDPCERLKVLQTGSVEVLSLIGCIRGTRKDEANIHKTFNGYRLHHEWFSCDDNMLTFIKERDCRNEYGIN